MTAADTRNLPTEFQTLIATHDKPVLVDFWAEWCGPCKMMAPVLTQLARAWKGRLTVIKVDTEAKPALAAHYGISSIPTLILFKDGREAHRLTGAVPLPHLQREFEPYL